MCGDAPDWVGDIPTWLTFIAAVIALWFAIKQVRSSREDAREQTAKEIWKAYYLHSIDHPELANPELSKLDFEKQELDGSRQEFYKYQWFVSFMLLACDEVLSLRGDGPDWDKFVENNVGYHRRYLNSRAFEKTQHLFSPKLLNKINEIK
jgi:hypothetical protein